MDIVYFKVVLLLNGWLFAQGAPLAMLQHATSSQSIVFHQPSSTSPATSSSVSSSDQYSSRNQPKYEYKYEVSDHQTGDRKTHWESREGDTVRGAYTLYEPDGALRTVEYTADSLHGFNAVVKRDESTKHQHRRPVDSYNLAANSVHDGYDASPSHARYATESFQNGKDRPRYSGSSGSFGPGVGFSVNHVVGLKKPGDSVNPY